MIIYWDFDIRILNFLKYIKNFLPIIRFDLQSSFSLIFLKDWVKIAKGKYLMELAATKENDNMAKYGLSVINTMIINQPIIKESYLSLTLMRRIIPTRELFF